eukprot:279955-Amphidinium_carterae.2
MKISECTIKQHLREEYSETFRSVCRLRVLHGGLETTVFYKVSLMLCSPATIAFVLLSQCTASKYKEYIGEPLEREPAEASVTGLFSYESSVMTEQDIFSLQGVVSVSVLMSSHHVGDNMMSTYDQLLPLAYVLDGLKGEMVREHVRVGSRGDTDEREIGRAAARSISDASRSASAAALKRESTRRVNMTDDGQSSNESMENHAEEDWNRVFAETADARQAISNCGTSLADGIRPRMLDIEGNSWLTTQSTSADTQAAHAKRAPPKKPTPKTGAKSKKSQSSAKTADQDAESKLDAMLSSHAGRNSHAQSYKRLSLRFVRSDPSSTGEWRHIVSAAFALSNSCVVIPRAHGQSYLLARLLEDGLLRPRAAAPRAANDLAHSAHPTQKLTKSINAKNGDVF